MVAIWLSLSVFLFVGVHIYAFWSFNRQQKGIKV